jgi:putative heme-binding domain-containing protein
MKPSPAFSDYRRWLLPSLLLALTASLISAFAGDYELADPELKVVRIDSDPKESFWGVQGDSMGRLFVGGREALFVYKPDPKGLYQPRKLLYRFPPNSWVSDIAIRGNDLYVLTHNALYLLEGAVTNREGLKPQRILWGLPPLNGFETHQGFHGLAFGREGDLYMAFGDNLITYGDFKRPDHWGHWTFFHGTNSTPYTGSGGVIRIGPDGNQFTSIARGMRNPCGLAFDAGWNLFTPDNDHESMEKDYPGRLLYVTPHAYFNWPRGWMSELQPWRADLLETMNSELGRYVPAGICYYNDTYLPEKFRNCLYVAEWGKAALMRYPLRENGAGFKADEFTLLTGNDNARPVGVGIGRGGRIFFTTLYMAGNAVSPVVKSDLLMITRAEDPATSPFTAYDPVTASNAKLTAELNDKSWLRRYRAHIELTRRGEMAPPKPADYAMLEKNLASKDLRVAHAALIAIFDGFDKFPFDSVCAFARSKDSYLRQTAAQLLAEKATLDQLQKLADAPVAADRLVGVLALGMRLTIPPATQPLPDYYSKTAPAFAPTAQYADEKVETRAFGPLSNFTMAEVWEQNKEKIPDGEEIFAILQRSLYDADEHVAKQAAFYLRLLADPRTDTAAAAFLKIKSDAILKPITGAVASTSTDLPAEYRKADWAAEAAAGNADAGRQLFNTRGCATCHAIKPADAGRAAPSLADVGKRFSVQYLAESILVPNKVVSPAFRWTALTLSDDEEIGGLVVGETETTLELLLVNGTHRTLDKKKITSRTIQDRSPMPEGLIQNRKELRDLLSFLTSQK